MAKEITILSIGGGIRGILPRVISAYLETGGKNVSIPFIRNIINEKAKYKPRLGYSDWAFIQNIINEKVQSTGNTCS